MIVVLVFPPLNANGLRGKIRRIINSASAFNYLFIYRLVRWHQFHPLSRDHSAAAHEAETTVASLCLTSGLVSSFL